MENETEDQEVIEVRPQGVSGELAVFVVVVVSFLAGGGGYLLGSRSPVDTPDHARACTQSEALSKAQIDAQKQQLEYAMQQQKNITSLQQQAMSACLTRGGTPQYQVGNVTCPK